MKNHFSALAGLYERLAHEQSGGPAVNPCGDCNICCTTSHLDSHRVTALELDFLESAAGSEKIDAFRLFLKRSGSVTICPYYEKGCTVYSARPFSCRVFGHYRREDTPLPEVCVFNGQEHIFGVGEYRSAVPEAELLAELSRDYWAFRRQREDLGETHYQAAGLGEPMGRALQSMALGDHSAALLHISEERATDPFTLYCKSLLYDDLDRPDLAFEVLRQAIGLAPQSPDLWNRLGCVLLAAGQREASEQAFRNTVIFHPGHGQAWGLLGLHRLMQDDPLEAVACLERAVALGADPAYRQRLDEARALVAACEL